MSYDDTRTLAIRVMLLLTDANGTKLVEWLGHGGWLWGGGAFNTGSIVQAPGGEGEGEVEGEGEYVQWSKLMQNLDHGTTPVK